MEADPADIVRSPGTPPNRGSPGALENRLRAELKRVADAIQPGLPRPPPVPAPGWRRTGRLVLFAAVAAVIAVAVAAILLAGAVTW